jgi:hypothetical protein
MDQGKVLLMEQIEQFIEEGYTCLREGFSREAAEPVLQQVWELLPAELGIRRDDPTTWRHLTVKPAKQPSGPEVAALYTPRVCAAFDDLLGAGRWVERGESTGAWPFTFPGFAEKPWRPMSGWHVDGGGRRYLNAPQQGLIAIMLFSDIGPGDGGTALRVGSHRTTACVLHAAGDAGLDGGQYQDQAVRASEQLPVIEAQGAIGDVLLCDGFLVHSQSNNVGSKVRIITNNAIHLHEPMNFARPDGDYSVRERSIRKAIE